MITILSSPKAFIGSDGNNQINAIKSWINIHPEIEIILYGKSEGAAQVCNNFGIKYCPDIESNSFNLPYFNAIVNHAAVNAKYEIQMYLNCDVLINNAVIKFMKSFPFKGKFLIVGQRIDLDRGINLNMENGGWLDELRRLVNRGKANLHGVTGKDYFIFPRGMWYNLMPLIIGRGSYDSALIAFCLRKKIPVIDATQIIPAIHLFHGYQIIKGNNKNVTQDHYADQNRKLHDILHSAPTIADSDWIVQDNHLKRNFCRQDWIRFLEIWFRFKKNQKVISYCIRFLDRLLQKSKLKCKNTYSIENIVYNYIKLHGTID